MSSFGQKHAAASSAIHGRSQVSPILAPKPTPASAKELNLGKRDWLVRYMGEKPLSLRGLRSGREYYFSEAGKTAIIDERDIEALLRT